MTTRRSRSERIDPRLAVAVAVLFTSFSSIFIRLSEAPSLAIAANRMILTTIMLLPLVARERFARRTGPNVPVGPKLLFLCLASGLLLALHFATWIRSLALTTIASATVIVNSQPLFVVAAGLLLYGERIGRRAFLCILLTLAGGVVLSSGDLSLGPSALIGDLYALAGAASVAGYLVIGRYVRRVLPVGTYVFVVYASSAIFLSLFATVAGVPLAGYPVREYLLFAGMAFFCTILGHTTFNWALEHLPTATVSTMTLGEPLFATLLGMSIFAEVPPALTVAGGTIMLAGLVLFIREEGRVANPFDEKAKSWDENPETLERNRAIGRSIRESVDLSPEARVLDYGAGTGLLAFELSPFVGSILAVDTSTGMLEALARKLSDGAKIEVLRHDLEAEPLDGHEFDLICTAMTMHHVKELSLVLDRFVSLLAPGGTLCIADLEGEDGSFHASGAGVAHHGFDPAGLAKLVTDAGLVAVRTKRIHRLEREREGVKRHYDLFLLCGEKE